MLDASHRERGAVALFLLSAIRVLFTTLLFTCGGMGLGLLLGIIGMVSHGLAAGVQPDMRNAYRHFAIPVAIIIGSIAFLGALVLELRARRTQP
jgi:hypothetical protein